MTKQASAPIKALVNRRNCWDCAFPISDPHSTSCPRCGSSDISNRKAQPTVKSDARPAPKLPFPWNDLNLELGGTVLLSGNAGSGKTTLTLKSQPTRFMSSEQENEKVKHSWDRIVGNHVSDARVPIFSVVSSWEELQADLIGIDEDDVIVVDSISQLASAHESGRVVSKVIEQIRLARARAFFIAQFTKGGDMLGPNELNHLVDVVATIPDDPTGLRRLAVKKNRYGSLFSQYFGLDGRGVIQQKFEYAYSVEGSAGKYRLHLYPMPGGAKLTGIFEDLAEAGISVMECASAAVRCNMYNNGYAEPPDVDFRREFAEKHGLNWIGPEDAADLLASNGGED